MVAKDLNILPLALLMNQLASCRWQIQWQTILFYIGKSIQNVMLRQTILPEGHHDRFDLHDLSLL